MPHKHLPIIVLEELKEIIPRILNIVKANESIVQIEIDRNLNFVVKDKEPLEDGSFYSFKMDSPTFKSHKAYCQITYRPASIRENIIPASFSVEVKQVLELFEKWMSFIKTYSEYQILEEDSIKSYYQEYFLNVFESLDHDASVHPFSLVQQIVVVEFIDRVLLILNDNEENDGLAVDAQVIADEVSQNTKQTVVKQISNLLAKAHQKSLPLVKRFLEEALKTIFKNITEGAIKGIRDILENPHLLG